MGKDFSLITVKYLGIKIDPNFNWKQQISDVAIKLNRANTILSKLKHFVDRKTLKSIYHAIFKPHLCYSLLVWAIKNLNPIKIIFVLQNKYLRILYFQNHNAHTSPFFRESLFILKLPDKIAEIPENFVFVSLSSLSLSLSLSMQITQHILNVLC